MKAGTINSAIAANYGRLDANFNLTVDSLAKSIDELEAQYPDIDALTKTLIAAVLNDSTGAIRRAIERNVARSNRSAVRTIEEYPYICAALLRELRPVFLAGNSNQMRQLSECSKALLSL